MSARVLIVDDEPHIRRVMRMTLESAGYEVAEAADGTAGLEKFGDGSKCAAVVLDQRMPGMDGLETLRRMKARSPHAPIVMVTAYASVQLAVDAMKLGATDFMQKPMTPDVLRKTVRSAVQSYPVSDTSGETDPLSRPGVSRMTMNGFRIWPDRDLNPETPLARQFAVETPDGSLETVLLEISPEAVQVAERMARRRFPALGEFWTCLAEKALSAHLWTAGEIPSGGRLRVCELDPTALEMAMRWDGQDC